MGTSFCTSECLSGDALVAQLRDWIHRVGAWINHASARDLAIHNAEGESIADIPLLLAILLAVIKPHLALLGAIVLLAMRGSIAVRAVRE
jgi:Domain of unknown function (DUF4342)